MDPLYQSLYPILLEKLYCQQLNPYYQHLFYQQDSTYIQDHLLMLVLLLLAALVQVLALALALVLVPVQVHPLMAVARKVLEMGCLGQLDRHHKLVVRVWLQAAL